jgi:hypothetical protein
VTLTAYFCSDVTGDLVDTGDSQGAVDPTFGIDPGGKTHWERSLEEMQLNMKHELTHGYDRIDYFTSLYLYNHA